MTHELHLIASAPSHGERYADPDATAKLLGTHETREAAHRAGRIYLSEHPAAWLQVCEPGGQGEEIQMATGISML